MFRTENTRILSTVALTSCLLTGAPHLAAEETTPPTSPEAHLELLQARYLSDRQAGVEGIAALDAAQQQACVDRLMELIDAEDWRWKKAAAKALAAIGTTAAKRLPGILERMRTALEVGKPQHFHLLSDTAAGLLGREPDRLRPVFDLMRTAMAEDDPARYEKLAAALHADDADLVATLTAIIRAAEGESRAQAISALAELGGPQAAPILAEIMKDGGNHISLREEAAVALGRLGGDTAVTSLTGMVEDPATETRLRSRAILALAAAAGADAVPSLITATQDGTGDIRRQAVEALAGLGTDAAPAMDILLAVGADEEEPMQRHIQKTIQKIKADNQPPQVEAVNASCNEGKSTTLELPVTAVDDLPFVLKTDIAEQPQHGSLERTGPATFVYHSEPGFKGEDMFEWVGTDGQDKSEPVACTVDVQPDTEGPQIVSVMGNGKASLRVTFNEEVTEASAADAGNYSVDQGITVSAAELAEDGRSVVLETTALADGADYTLSASGIADRSKANNTADAQRSFTYESELPGLVYRYYETKDFDALTGDPDAVEPTATGTVDTFGKEPAQRGKNYALDFSGTIKIQQAGEHVFYTASDDGSHLWIDGEMIVDNGGMHGVEEQSGTLELSPGSHEIRVFFYQGGGGHDLIVRWQAPGADKEEIPAKVLFHLPGAE